MATFEECKKYFKCDETGELTDEQIIGKAINGTPCKSKNNNKVGQTSQLGRCKKVCTHFKDMKKDDASKMCRLAFRLSEEMVDGINDKKVEYSTIPFDGSQVFTPILPTTYEDEDYEDIFDNYFIKFDLNTLKLVSENNQTIGDIYLAIKNYQQMFPNYKGFLLHKEIKSHKDIIESINKLLEKNVLRKNNILKKNNKTLKNNKYRSKVYANTFRHTECHQEGAVLKESNPTLICKKSKKLKRLDPCKGKMCWHRKGPGDSVMYYFSIKEAKEQEKQGGGSRKQNRNINKSKKNSKKSRKNKKFKKNHKRSKNSNK